MPMFTFRNVKIAGIASAVPTKVVRVEDFVQEFGENTVSKFKAQTGIEQFRKSHSRQTASDLGYAAAELLLKEKHVDPRGIGALIFVSHSTDYRRPATACVLQKRLGISKQCAAFDINLGCSAYVYGIVNACSLMNNSDISRALLIVGETLTKLAHPKDRSVGMLFGDGGSATLLEKSDSAGVIHGLLRSDGNAYKAIIAPAGGFRNMDASTELMTWKDGSVRTLYNAHMNGIDVFNFTISDVPAAISDFMQHTDTTVDDYDCFAFHQANKFIHKQLARKLKIPKHKFPISLDRFGNTSAPAIPLTLCDTYARNDPHEVRTLMCGFGVGLSWGVTTAVIRTTDILPIIDTDACFDEGVIDGPDDL